MQLNTEQTLAVAAIENKIVAIACPGSGKTRTLVERVKRIMADGAKPCEIILITFTNAAADEMIHRLQADGADTRFNYAGTLHGYMLRELNRDAGGRLAIIDEDQREEMLEAIAKELNFKGKLDKAEEIIRQGPGAPVSSGGPALVALSYFQQLGEAGLVDFDLILHAGLSLLKSGRFQIGAARWLFVDEYQDSGKIDAAFYNLLPVENKFFVGDPNQSIYGFRYSSVEYIEAMQANPQFRAIRLENNYRCAQVVCDVANRMIAHNPAARATMQSAAPYKGEVEQRVFGTALQECVFIAEQAQGLNAAVLLRTNPLVREYRETLIKLGVAVKQRKLAARPKDWKVARMFVNLLANPNNDLLAYNWIKQMGNARQAEAAKLKALGKFASINSQTLLLPDKTEARSIPALLNRAGISSDSVAMVESLIAGNSRIESAVELAFYMGVESVEEEGDGLTISTIHGAKGLEWDAVFLPAFEQGICPLIGEKYPLEEERRIAYVAMTRARMRLVITRARERQPSWKKFPGAEPVYASQFLGEAGLSME